MEALATKIGQDPQNVYRQLGTLGGGNHFIEIGEADGDWYIFIHTGSRNFGLQVCKYHAAKAKANGSKYLFRKRYEGIFRRYDCCPKVCRPKPMCHRSKYHGALGITGEYVCDTTHNYIDFTRNIIRKGAVRAEADETLVIPMNMRDGVLLCKGKGKSRLELLGPSWSRSRSFRAQAKRQARYGGV